MKISTFKPHQYNLCIAFYELKFEMTFGCIKGIRVENPDI